MDRVIGRIRPLSNRLELLESRNSVNYIVGVVVVGDAGASGGLATKHKKTTKSLKFYTGYVRLSIN